MGELALLVIVHAALVEDQSSVLSTHVRRLMTKLLFQGIGCPLLASVDAQVADTYTGPGIKLNV